MDALALNICHVNLARGFSGGESQTLALIKEHIRLGHKVNVVAKTASPFAETCKKLACTVHEVRHYLTGHSKSITQDSAAVHVHEGQAVYWALLQHILFKTPYIITRRIDNAFKDKWFSNIAYRKAACIVCVSHAVESVVRAQFPDTSTNVVNDSPISYPVDENLLSSLCSKYQDKFVVIQAAKLYKHKGFDVTISAAKRLAKHTDIHFCLLGDGPELKALQEQASGLKNVEFLGRQNDMGTWFARADVVVLPSHTEGMGSVLLEATLAGVPVIGTRAGGIPDAIQHEVNGLLIDVGDAEALAHALLRLVSDDQLIHEISVRAPEFIEGFSIQRAAQRYEHVYENL
ncbi:glycosyltransferase family 4 protein [Oleiphilus sp. HI0079]|uniref:glycosyltransferase family 4 protein n=2 Tax=Oleiphilus sp. HI0079 TaxID=1822254 RepID=UPI0009EDDEED|nr:glycosyltransferase family 4 protein [Oleiphilus sp. HI0079]